MELIILGVFFLGVSIGIGLDVIERRLTINRIREEFVRQLSDELDCRGFFGLGDSKSTIH